MIRLPAVGCVFVLDAFIGLRHALKADHVAALLPWLRAVAAPIGINPGLSGSAALIVLTVSTIRSPSLGLFLTVIEAGAIAAMAMLSMLMAMPKRSVHPLSRLPASCSDGLSAA